MVVINKKIFQPIFNRGKRTRIIYTFFLLLFRKPSKILNVKIDSKSFAKNKKMYFLRFLLQEWMNVSYNISLKNRAILGQFTPKTYTQFYPK